MRGAWLAAQAQVECAGRWMGKGRESTGDAPWAENWPPGRHEVIHLGFWTKVANQMNYLSNQSTCIKTIYGASNIYLYLILKRQNPCHKSFCSTSSVLWLPGPFSFRVFLPYPFFFPF